LFISLPVFALLLLMVYARRNFYYAEHGIFTIHLYCAVFIILLFYFGIDKLQDVTGWSWLTGVKDILVLGIFFYLYKAMRKFYGQKRFKTILKFIVLNFFSAIVVSLLIVLFFFLSIMQFS
jgi:RsiW-degrading membrane proteinase PrsW (M82 family)